MNVELKNTINLDIPEDYSRIGNSRIGGRPDLPKNIDYPISPNGFYEFIIQINLGDFSIHGLPNKGMISIFYGNLDYNEALGFYFEDISALELKEIPKNMEFSGVTDFHESIPYKVKIESKKIKNREEQNQYNDDRFTEEENIHHWQLGFLWDNSFLLDDGVGDKTDLYFKTNDFGLIDFAINIDEKNNKLIYQGQNANKKYDNIDDLKNCEITTYYEGRRWPVKPTREEWITQLEKFEKEKEYHFRRFREYKCLLSLQSLDKTRMIWGDYHKLEIYGYKSDFINLNFGNINSTFG